MGGPEYTKEEDTTIKFLFARGKTDDEIGLAVGRGGVSIRGRRQDLNLFRRQPRVPGLPEKIEKPITKKPQADNLPDIGVQMNDLALAVGLVNANVQDVLSEMKVQTELMKETYALFRRLEDKSKPLGA